MPIDGSEDEGCKETQVGKVKMEERKRDGMDGERGSKRSETQRGVCRGNETPGQDWREFGSAGFEGGRGETTRGGWWAWKR